MDIPRHKFSSELVKILQLIADSHFVALDLEFSGIPSRRNRGSGGKLSLQEVYEETKEAALQYQVFQVGLTIVEEDAQKGVYIIRPHNFYINPIPAKEDYHHLERIWSCQSGAIAFLLKNKFRFDLPFSEGIPYISRKEEAQIRASWAVRDDERETPRDMVLKVADKPLIDHIHISVRKWLSYPLTGREDYLNIPDTTEECPRLKNIPNALNRYQIRLTHHTIRKDYKDLKTIGRDGFVRVSVRNEKEDAEEKLRQERYREQDVLQAIEFRWLIEALCGGDISKIPERCFVAAMPGEGKPSSDNAPLRQLIDTLQQKLSTRRRVLFGHNCFIDLVYLYACFIGDPPEQVEDFQELIHELFPAVVDTKYLASLVKELRHNSDLGKLEKDMEAEKVPVIEVPTAFGRYLWGERCHEAGYDSFMTAKIAIKLSAKLEREGKLRKPQRMANPGETIWTDTTADPEEEDQADEYVTASESAAETDSCASGLTSKLTVACSAAAQVTNEISQPLARRHSSGTGPSPNLDLHVDGKNVMSGGELQPGAEREPAQAPDDDPTPHRGDTEPETSASSTHVVAFKQKKAHWRSRAEAKRIKNALRSNNLFDILDTPIGPTTDRRHSAEDQPVDHSIPGENERQEGPEADLLIWSDKEDHDGGEQEGDETSSEGAPIQAREVDRPMSAQGLETKLIDMASKGEMMPRWDSESGIWKLIGNKLLVNASEEGVCLL